MSDIKEDAKEFVKDLILGSLETILPKPMVKAIEEGEKLVEDIVEKTQGENPVEEQQEIEKKIEDVNNSKAEEISK